MLPVDFSRVRLARPEDEDGLMAMCRLLHEESGLRDALDRPLPWSEDKVRATVQRAIIPNRNWPSYCAVIDAGDAIEASIYLDAGEIWYSDALALRDIWNFVHPEHRKTAHAKTLIAFAQEVARYVHHPVVLNIMSMHRTAAKERFIERMGWDRLGGYFVYTPTASAAQAGAF